MPLFLQKLGIHSEHEAAELERDLGVSFKDFTPEDCETWIHQSVYLEQYSKTRAGSLAADDAGVTIRTARQWQVENTLGFNQRLEIAVLRYTDVIEVMLLQHAKEPKASPLLLMMLARAHMPEKYGSARRSGPPRDSNPCDHECNHNSQPTTTSQYDQALLEEIFRDLQNLKQFAGMAEPAFTPAQPEPTHSDLTPAGEETQREGPFSADPTPTGAGFNPAHDLSPTEEENTSHSDLSPTRQEDTALPNLSPTRQEDTALPNLSPDGGETQRGGSSPTSSHPSASSAVTPPPTLQHPSPNTQNLSRRQRRQLQRDAKRNHQTSHFPRAPN